MALIGMQFSLGFFLGSPTGVFLGIPDWLATLQILLGGLLFWKYPLGSPMPLCVNLIVLIVGLMVLDCVVHKLNPVCHEMLHLWRIFVACWFVSVEIYCVWYSLCSWLGDACLMASLVFHLWSFITAVFSMWCPWWSIVWPIVNDYSFSWWA